MFVSRLTKSWRQLTLALAAVSMTLASGIAAPAAHADDLPFWERADAAAKAQKASSKVSKKTYASKPSSKTSKSASKKSSKSYASNTSSKKLGGHAEATEPKKKKHTGVKVAALGDSYYSNESSKPKKSLSGGGVSWVASAGCLDGSLKAVVYQVASNYGPVTVNSTCRSRGHNASVGGAPKSKHLSGDAVDFRVHGNVGAVYAYLKGNGSVGGLKHYGGGLFHIDNGDRRSW